MRVLVLLGLGADTRVPPERDPRSGRVREEWLVREIDPAGVHALDLALHLKAARPDTHVTVMHLGPPGFEAWLRRALARGADRAVRVWDDETAGVNVAAKAVILAAAAQAEEFDLILTGAAGVVDAGGQLGVLVAADLGVPCVTQVIDIDASDRAGGAPDSEAAVELGRGLDRGFRERVEAVLPVVATVVAGAAGADATPPDIPASALLAAQAGEIVVWDLADLGVPLERVRRAGRSLSYGRPRSRHPRLRHISAPDPTLPAFDRILKLIQGSVQRREGRVVRQPADTIADEIFRALKEEGWLDHLRSGDRRGAKGPEAGDRS